MDTIQHAFTHAACKGSTSPCCAQLGDLRIIIVAASNSRSGELLHDGQLDAVLMHQAYGLRFLANRFLDDNAISMLSNHKFPLWISDLFLVAIGSHLVLILLVVGRRGSVSFQEPWLVIVGICCTAHISIDLRRFWHWNPKSFTHFDLKFVPIAQNIRIISLGRHPEVRPLAVVLTFLGFGRRLASSFGRGFGALLLLGL